MQSGLFKLFGGGGSTEPIFYRDPSLGPELSNRRHLKSATALFSSLSFHRNGFQVDINHIF